MRRGRRPRRPRMTRRDARAGKSGACVTRRRGRAPSARSRSSRDASPGGRVARHERPYPETWPRRAMPESRVGARTLLTREPAKRPWRAAATLGATLNFAMEAIV